MTANGLAAVIVGGGRSRRMGGADKLYASLGSGTVLAATLDVFQAAAMVDAVALVVAAERVDYCQGLARDHGWTKVLAVCAGGASRSHSVANGLRALADVPAAYVAVHDAARPFVTTELIARALAAAREHGAAAPGLPCADTIKRVAADGRARETLSRDSLRAIQTPQVFSRPLLERAYRAQAGHLAAYTDDAAVVEAAGGVVYVAPGDYANMKITTPTDLAFAQWRVQRSKEGA